MRNTTSFVLEGEIPQDNSVFCSVYTTKVLLLYLVKKFNVSTSYIMYRVQDGLPDLRCFVETQQVTLEVSRL
jgi:hypothetical protein